VPFKLVPSHVAKKYGSAEALSMYENLQQAHEAFVFSPPFAALALMRSIMEEMLRDHYDAKGKNLCERINQASERPSEWRKCACLHRLRKLANVVLHRKPEKDERLPKIEPVRLEKQILSLLFVRRALIEGAPQSRIR
jgi:hypothetical protein